MKIKRIIKGNIVFIIFIVVVLSFLYIKLPYYIMAEGGTINITDRVVMDDYKKEGGSINMLYVSEYDATGAMILLSKLKGWDINKISDKKISNESNLEVEKRNKIMRDNSLDIATMVAYQEAGKHINIKNKKNIVIGITENNNLKIGDVILEVNDKQIEDITDIKKIINASKVDDIIKFKILRNNKEIIVNNKVTIQGNEKVIGVIIITKYDYNLEPKIDIKFKDSESGSSGGLMLTLTIYNAISGTDIIKNRNIAGTGTISLDGSVGEIDGIKYKIMGAYKDNMDIVFVPSANYKEAMDTIKKYNYDLEIVKVDTFKEAINYLKNN